MTRGSRPRHSYVLVNLVLYQPQVLLDDATLVWSDGESIDVPVGDAGVVNDCICLAMYPSLELMLLVYASDGTVLKSLLPQKCFPPCLVECRADPQLCLLSRSPPNDTLLRGIRHSPGTEQKIGTSQ